MPMSSSVWREKETPCGPAKGGAKAVGSPVFGSSILMTSAPSPARNSVPCGPEKKRVRSRTTTPSRIFTVMCPPCESAPQCRQRVRGRGNRSLTWRYRAALWLLHGRGTRPLARGHEAVRHLGDEFDHAVRRAAQGNDVESAERQAPLQGRVGH